MYLPKIVDRIQEDSPARRRPDQLEILAPFLQETEEDESTVIKIMRNR